MLFPKIVRAKATLGRLLQTSMELHIQSKNPWWYGTSFMNHKIEEVQINVNAQSFEIQEIDESKPTLIAAQQDVAEKMKVLAAKYANNRGFLKVHIRNAANEYKDTRMKILQNDPTGLAGKVPEYREKIKASITEHDDHKSKVAHTIRFYNLNTKNPKDYTTVATIDQPLEEIALQVPLSQTFKGNKVLMSALGIVDFLVMGIAFYLSIAHSYAIRVPTSGAYMFVTIIVTAAFNLFMLYVFMFKHPVKLIRAAVLGEYTIEDRVHVIYITNSPSVDINEYLENLHHWDNEGLNRVINSIQNFPMVMIKNQQDTIEELQFEMQKMSFDKGQRDRRQHDNNIPSIGSPSRQATGSTWNVIIASALVIISVLVVVKLYL